jgi:hypothetical protein
MENSISFKHDCSKINQITPLQALIGIDATTPLIQAALNDLSHDLTPVRNLELDDAIVFTTQ